MLIVAWTPITKTVEIPPMGDELKSHLEARKGAAKHASYSAWNLLYRTVLENGLPESTVSFTDTGKPYFSDSDVFFSLSHSHGICAVALADRPVGVDMEMVKESYNLHLIERSLAESEKSLFDGDFTRIWCRKEAIAKMKGEGITGYPNSIDTTQYEFNELKIVYEGMKYWLVVV